MGANSLRCARSHMKAPCGLEDSCLQTTELPGAVHNHECGIEAESTRQPTSDSCSEVQQMGAWCQVQDCDTRDTKLQLHQVGKRRNISIPSSHPFASLLIPTPSSFSMSFGPSVNGTCG